MTAEEQKRMQALEAENAKLREEKSGLQERLLATCKARGVDERTWLEDVLRRIPQYEQGRMDYSDLLPGNWVANSK